MRIGLVADIHGNSFALQQVLDELTRVNVDSIVCLGDIAVLGPDPAGAIASIRKHSNLVVQGNVDRWLVNRLDDRELSESPNSEMSQMAAWSLDQLDADALAWLDALPLMETMPLPGERELLAVHGSSRSNDEVIGPSSPDAEVRAMMPDRLPTMICGGHTHVQFQRAIDNSVFVNPGSVGLPGVGPGTPGLPTNTDVEWTEYAVLTVQDSDSVGIDFRRTKLDVEAMIEWSRTFGMPAINWWISKWART